MEKELKNKAVDLLNKKEPIALLMGKGEDNIWRKITVFPSNKELCTYIWCIERWDFEKDDIVADYKTSVSKDVFSLVDGLFALFPIKAVKALF